MYPINTLSHLTSILSSTPYPNTPSHSPSPTLSSTLSVTLRPSGCAYGWSQSFSCRAHTHLTFEQLQDHAVEEAAHRQGLGPGAAPGLGLGPAAKGPGLASGGIVTQADKGLGAPGGTQGSGSGASGTLAGATPTSTVGLPGRYYCPTTLLHSYSPYRTPSDAPSDTPSNTPSHTPILPLYTPHFSDTPSDTPQNTSSNTPSQHSLLPSGVKAAQPHSAHTAASVFSSQDVHDLVCPGYNPDDGSVCLQGNPNPPPYTFYPHHHPPLTPHTFSPLTPTFHPNTPPPTHLLICYPPHLLLFSILPISIFFSNLPISTFQPFFPFSFLFHLPFSSPPLVQAFSFTPTNPAPSHASRTLSFTTISPVIYNINSSVGMVT